MALDRSRDRGYVGLRATSALAMALFEQSGLRGLLDERILVDKRRKLSIGYAVKAFIGDMMGHADRRALSRVSDPFMSAPVSEMFGEKMDLEGLGATALSRDLDIMFEADLPAVTYDCYRLLASRYGLDSNIFNIDSTNFGISAKEKTADIEGAAVPEWCGHPKDSKARIVYSLLSVTDENSIVCYERPYDGATADSEMDRGAIEFLSGKVDPSSTTLVADCKIATAPLVGLMTSEGFGFVAKCPENFGRKVRDDIVYSVSTGTMDPSSVRDGWEIYDTDAEVDGMMLRFVAYRTSDDIQAGIEYHREQDLKEAQALLGRFSSRLFNCEEDARRAITEALGNLGASAYEVGWAGSEVESRSYGHRGRPRKDEKPTVRTEYRVDVSLEFDEERAKELSKDRSVRVLVTNLPRANGDAENIRFGATADTVLLTYLGQYRVEHAFRLMKDGMSMKKVYIQKPSRENAMMFVISIATMLTDLADHVLKREGVDTTFSDFVRRSVSLILARDPVSGDEHFMGPSILADEFMDVSEALGIDTDRLMC